MPPSTRSSTEFTLFDRLSCSLPIRSLVVFSIIPAVFNQIYISRDHPAHPTSFTLIEDQVRTTTPAPQTSTMFKKEYVSGSYSEPLDSLPLASSIQASPGSAPSTRAALAESKKNTQLLHEQSRENNCPKHTIRPWMTLFSEDIQSYLMLI